MYGAECWIVRKKEERKLHTTELRMLRCARGRTRLDHVRSVDTWKEAHMHPMAEFIREKRLIWFGNVQRQDKDITNDTRRKTKSRQTKGEMARPGKRGFGQKPDDV